MILNLNQLLQKAKKQNTKTIAIAAADDKYVMTAIAKAKELGLIAPIFIGDSSNIKAIAKEINFKISEKEIIHKNNVNASCEEAVQLVLNGTANLIMKGLVPTKTLLQHITAQKNGLLNSEILSHLAIFESPNYPKLFGLTDAAMNIAPDLKEKALIIKNAVNTFHLLGIKTPKVAILAAVEKVNPKMQATTDAALLKEMAHKNIFGNCLIDGPLALDIALSKEAANHKNITSTVAGDTDILIAPDINSGNILYKALSFLGNAKCAAIITGSKAPIVLTSRADTEDTKFYSIVLGVLTSNLNSNGH
jgi:phosphate butyryltransferase